MKKLISLALALLSIAGICCAQTVVISDPNDPKLNNYTFTNTVANTPNVRVTNNTSGIIFNGCTFNPSSGGDAIDSGVDGTLISCVSCSGAGAGSTPGIFLNVSRGGALFISNCTLSGWSMVASMNGTVTQSVGAGDITINGNTFTNIVGPSTGGSLIYLGGIDQSNGGTNLIEVQNNAWTNPGSPGQGYNLVYIQNFNTITNQVNPAAALTVYITGNPVTNTVGTFKGYAGQGVGSFINFNIDSGANAKKFVIGMTYQTPPSNPH